MTMITMPNAEVDTSRYALPEAQKDVASNKLGQAEFLELMITQLQNQDPMQPMEGAEFISQMAQFSTVEEIGGVSRSVESLADSLGATTALQAATMVGRSVLIEGDTSQLGADSPLLGGVELPSPISNGVVQIFDTSGQLVRELPLGQQGRGVATFEWDGTMSDGSTADPGTYYINAAFMNGDTQQALPTFVASKVTSITLNAAGGGSEIVTEDGQVARLSQIKAIM